ncbi:MAG: PASTA domain-containing protein [Tannerella sp.]|jgi:beta-lactam-binding protein with PASTA domain|nr:PASTA domain-containing protein [Tannerella sp.]
MQIDIKEIRILMKRWPVLTHLISAIIIFCIIIFFVLKGLNAYTLHNQAIVIPDIKGLMMYDAAVFLENKGLRFEVIDSVYTQEVKSGAIVEVIPAIGSKVKKGRIVFIRINAYTAQMAAIPDVKDRSLRQGELLVKAQGFTSVEIKYVNSPYRDLIIGIELSGKLLSPGEMAPLTSALILHVGDGGLTQELTDVTPTEGTDSND